MSKAKYYRKSRSKKLSISKRAAYFDRWAKAFKKTQLKPRRGF